MKIALFGDIHGFFEHGQLSAIQVFQKVVASLKVDLILQLGDMCYYTSQAQPVYCIYGNNDFVKIFQELDRGENRLKNLIPIKTGEILSFKKDHEQIKLSGLNGAYDPLIYPLTRDQLREEWQKGYFVKEDMESCLGLKDLDIFLVHGCPWGLGFNWRGQDIGEKPIRLLVDAIKPRFMFCGHAHLYKEILYNKSIRIVSLAEFKREYYILDTLKGEITRIPVEQE